MKRIFTFCLAVVLAFSLAGCGGGAGGSQSAVEPSQSAAPSQTGASAAGSAPSSAPPAPSDPKAALPTTAEYIDDLVARTLEKFVTPGMSDFEKVKAAYDYLLVNAAYVDPVALDIWRIRSRGDTVPGYIETCSLSILNFGLGTCEDYAAALVLLLEGMGFEAQYVPGVTYHRQGMLVDHAWSMVRLEGQWYHLDSELEDNIIQNDTVTYRYFLKGDETMLRSHRWGQNLIDAGLLAPDQNEELAREYLCAPCPADWAAPPPQAIVQAPVQDKATVLAALQKELSAFEARFGALQPIDIDRVAPVFGRYYGYNRADIIGYDAAQWQSEEDHDRVLIEEPRVRQ